jgi:hypothetical protein
MKATGERWERRLWRMKRGPRKACFVGRGKAKIQSDFSACGKWSIVACALTKRVAAVGERGRRTVADEGTGHRNRGNWQTKLTSSAV